MSIKFSGWEVVDDGACFPGVLLTPAQKPQNKGVYTMFHGTSITSARAIITGGFQQSSSGMLGKGVYVSRDVKKAANYPLGSNPNDRVIFELRVRVGRVKRIDKDNHPLQFTWSSQGYNTAWVPPNCGMKSVPSGLEEDCVFDPKRVKVVGIARAVNYPETSADLAVILFTYWSKAWKRRAMGEEPSFRTSVVASITRSFQSFPGTPA
uniref:Grass carp reovirus (GCRV)-induced gene 2p n=1 Tax=Cyprinodon variegatus TaxID=28743 RepID=A0A3Q2DUG8_CYPVA